MNLSVIIIIVVIILTLVVPAIMIARLGLAAIKASARNPSRINKLYWGMIALLIVVEVVAIAAALILFRIFIE